MKLGVRDLTIQGRPVSRKQPGRSSGWQMVRDEGTWRNRRASGRISLGRHGVNCGGRVREGSVRLQRGGKCQTLVEDQLSRRGWRRPQGHVVSSERWGPCTCVECDARRRSVFGPNSWHWFAPRRSWSLVSHVPGMRVDELFPKMLKSGCSNVSIARISRRESHDPIISDGPWSAIGHRVRARAPSL